MALERISGEDVAVAIARIRNTARTLAELGQASIQTTTQILAEWGLDNVNCDKCGNTGQIVWQEDGNLHCKECECMAKRLSLRRIKNSGMEDMLERYTFDNYETPNEYRRLIKEQAIKFTKDDEGWFYIFGQSGSGKTHICTAICREFINSGIETYYMNWRDESVILKAIINDDETYARKINKLKTVPVLYIDDFLKAGSSGADVKLAFEILNGRYNTRKLRTIISCELTQEGIFEIDEAIAGRIYERAKRRNYFIKAPKENWRVREIHG